MVFDCASYSSGLPLFCLQVDAEQLPHSGGWMLLWAVLALWADRVDLLVLEINGTEVEGEKGAAPAI